MEGQAAPTAVSRLGLTRPQRLVPALGMALAIALPFSWFTDTKGFAVGPLLTASILTFIVAWFALSLPGLEIHPGLGFVIRGVSRRDLVGFADVQALEVAQFGAGRALIIHSRLGTWLVTAPTSAYCYVPDSAFEAKVALARNAWCAAVPEQRAPGPLVPWGPDPATAGAVTMAPRASQFFLRPTFLGSVALTLAIFFPYDSLFYARSREGGTAMLLTSFGLGIAIALWLWAGPRLVVRPDGLEIRRLRTTFVPWSLVAAITSRTARPGGFSLRPTRPDAAIVTVRILGPMGPIDLPAPLTGRGGGDPEFWRKVDFIERSWIAHRDDQWVGPPPPPRRA